ncbi:antitoxin component HigA of HigAB toxin-antitoxin module [Bradyrhizobium sp. USDA 4354]
MKALVIRSHRQYRHVLKSIEDLMSAEINSPPGVCLDRLVGAVEAWEQKHHRLATN